MKESIVHMCLDILKREDIKKEFKGLLKPVMDVIFYELTPYIYIIVALVFFMFVMMLATFILLLLFIRHRSTQTYYPYPMTE